MTMTQGDKSNPNVRMTEPRRILAVAYYRDGSQDRRESSIPLQQEQVRQWAEKNGFEIIQEFVDQGKSGRNARDRPAFKEMLANWVKKRNDFQCVLCLDFSRWGRFTTFDDSAYFFALYQHFGKEVIFTSLYTPHKGRRDLTCIPAVAYYRHIVNDHQENSISIQRDLIREWAEKNGVEIIQEFADHSKPGQSEEDRPAFEMLIDWVQQRDDFQYVLCIDLRCWGRFSSLDRSAVYCKICQESGKQVIFTNMGRSQQHDPLRAQFERSRAAQSRKRLMQDDPFLQDDDPPQ